MGVVSAWDWEGKKIERNKEGDFCAGRVDENDYAPPQQDDSKPSLEIITIRTPQQIRRFDRLLRDEHD